MVSFVLFGGNIIHLSAGREIGNGQQKHYTGVMQYFYFIVKVIASVPMCESVLEISSRNSQ